MSQLFATVRGVLAEHALPFQENAAGNAFRFGFLTETHRWICQVQVREEQHVVVFASMLPLAVAPGRRAAVAELLTRINAGLAIGNFEMDWDEGAVRFRTSIDVEGVADPAPLIRQIVRANLSTTARHIAAVEQVTAGSATPVDALAALAAHA